MKGASERAAKEFYDAGQALLRLKKEKAYTSLNYASFEALLEGKAVCAKAPARKKRGR